NRQKVSDDRPSRAARSERGARHRRFHQGAAGSRAGLVASTGRAGGGEQSLPESDRAGTAQPVRGGAHADRESAAGLLGGLVRTGRLSRGAATQSGQGRAAGRHLPHGAPEAGPAGHLRIVPPRERRGRDGGGAGQRRSETDDRRHPDITRHSATPGEPNNMTDKTVTVTKPLLAAVGVGDAVYTAALDVVSQVREKAGTTADVS